MILVLAFRVLLVVLATAMALISIERLHDYCQEEYKRTQRLFKSLSLLSAALHVLVMREVSVWHCGYSLGTALLYSGLAGKVQLLEVKDLVGMLGLTVMNHAWWFWHFLQRGEEVERVTACYVLLVWMVPVFYLAACTTDATHLPSFDGTKQSDNRRKEEEDKSDYQHALVHNGIKKIFLLLLLGETVPIICHGNRQAAVVL